MCSYLTLRSEMAGSAKGQTGWFKVTDALCYFDHPYHAAHDHTLNIDFINQDAGPSARCAVELTAESARELVRIIEAAMEASGEAAA